MSSTQLTMESRGHLPTCRLQTWREIADDMSPHMSAELLKTVGENADTGGIVVCADGCPRLGKATKRGRELARRLGW